MKKDTKPQKNKNINKAFASLAINTADKCIVHFEEMRSSVDFNDSESALSYMSSAFTALAIIKYQVLSNFAKVPIGMKMEIFNVADANVHNLYLNEKKEEKSDVGL